MERLSIDFKGPLETSTGESKYLFTAVDEYSRYPFAFSVPDTSSKSVIMCLDQIFSLCGYPNYIHSDRGSSLLSQEVENYLRVRGIAHSRSTPYHPTGNAQIERYNGIIWKSIALSLKQHNLPILEWERAISLALHSIRTLLCTATNQTPHERFFNFQRRTGQGTSLPSWLTTPGPVLLRNHTRSSKTDPLVREVELLHANPNYAYVKMPDGQESSVALRDLARCPATESDDDSDDEDEDDAPATGNLSSDSNSPASGSADDQRGFEKRPSPRRSQRSRRPPDRLNYKKLGGSNSLGGQNVIK